MSAKHSIVVCMYCFTSQELIDVLIKAHQKGVVVRVITDCEQESINGKPISQLRQAGIQVRTDESSYFMHHKFTVLDGDILINGSLNWTLQGLRGNQENFIITNEFELVKALFINRLSWLCVTLRFELDTRLITAGFCLYYFFAIN